MGKELGGRIRDIRKDCRLTLAQVAEGTELSKGFLSQVERGLAEPSISSLKKIARFLGTNVVALVGEQTGNGRKQSQAHSLSSQSQPIDGPRDPMSGFVQDVQVVTADRRKRLAFPGSPVSYDLLSPDLNRRMEVLFLKAENGATSGEEPIVDPPGEKFGLVLKGSIEVLVGENTYSLKEGDSIYFPCHLPHSWKVTGNPHVELVWVMTPPSF